MLSGKIKNDTRLINNRTGAEERLSKIMWLKGGKQEDAGEIIAGDIGSVSKLGNVLTGDTLSASGKLAAAAVDFPAPTISVAVYPKAKGDEEKITQAFSRLCEEDPTIKVYTDNETHEQILSALGEQHIDVIISRLKSKFGAEVELKKPKIAYRETIRRPVKVQGRHKKQSGGHGQFGDVWIEFEPCDSDELVFEEKVFGGSVPKNFFPAVEKGLREACVHGPLAGYPVVNLKAVLYDGSYHPVDSSEIAFKTAANLAYKAAMPEASPVLLEPVCELKVTVPDQYMGDILGDLNKRRGRVMGMTPTGNGEQIIEAECPEAELMSYAIDLRSMTQSRGSFVMHFVRYEQCSADAQAKAVAAAKAMQEAE